MPTYHELAATPTYFVKGQKVRLIHNKGIDVFPTTEPYYKVLEVSTSSDGFQSVSLGDKDGQYLTGGLYGGRFEPYPDSELALTIEQCKLLPKGTKLMCVDDKGTGQNFRLKLGEVYTFDETAGTCIPTIHVKESSARGCWYPKRFMLLKQREALTLFSQPNKALPTPQPPQKKMNKNYNLRDKTGKFRPRVSQPVFAAPKVAHPAPNTKPLVLKRGSLYRISGGPVARFKVAAYDNFVTLSVHGKPITVDKKRVKLADKDDVDQYLADAKAL